MDIKTEVSGGRTVAVLGSGRVVLTDTRSALDLIAEVRYTAGASRVAIPKEAVAEDFFILSTGLAGEILQKFTNYGMKCAIFGDFSGYTSKPLQDFLRESDRGTQVLFPPDAASAVERLGAVE